MLNGRALDEKSGCVGSNPTWYVEIMKVNKYHHALVAQLVRADPS